jgi:Fic family protein
LYSTPQITINEVEKTIKISKNSSNLLIKDLVKIGVLKEITKNKRNKIFSFYEYLQLFNQ